MFDPISLALNPPRFMRGGIRLAPARREPDKQFTWPLGRLGNRDPMVLAHHDSDRRGVDLGYSPAIFDPELYVPVYAANDGEVAMALEGPKGFEISIDHGGTWTTYYSQLSKTFLIASKPRLKRRERVDRGQVIGYAAKAPIQIGFELWRWSDDHGFVSVDPLAHMKTWANTPSSIVPASETEAA